MGKMCITVIVALLILMAGGVGRSSASIQVVVARCAYPLTYINLSRPYGTFVRINAGTGVTTIGLTDGVYARGTDRNGRPWTVDLGSNWLISDCYVRDLDGDSTNDIIYVQFTWANGNLPNVILSIVTFDPSGAPVLFHAFSTMGWTKRWIDGLCDLDRDRNTDLVVRELRDDGGKDKFDAYYVTSVYTLRQGRWQQHARDRRP
jgi:hypothetical protein